MKKIATSLFTSILIVLCATTIIWSRSDIFDKLTVEDKAMMEYKIEKALNLVDMSQYNNITFRYEIDSCTISLNITYDNVVCNSSSQLSSELIVAYLPEYDTDIIEIPGIGGGTTSLGIAVDQESFQKILKLSNYIVPNAMVPNLDNSPLREEMSNNIARESKKLNLSSQKISNYCGTSYQNAPDYYFLVHNTNEYSSELKKNISIYIENFCR